MHIYIDVYIYLSIYTHTHIQIRKQNKNLIHSSLSSSSWSLTEHPHTFSAAEFIRGTPTNAQTASPVFENGKNNIQSFVLPTHIKNPPKRLRTYEHIKGRTTFFFLLNPHKDFSEDSWDKWVNLLFSSVFFFRFFDIQHYSYIIFNISTKHN